MATITVGATVLSPALILNDDRSREAGNVVIEVIDAPDPYVSLGESKTPTQQLEALFLTEPEAQAALDLVSSGRPIIVATDARLFTCVKVGVASIGRASRNRARWILNVEVREL